MTMRPISSHERREIRMAALECAVRSIPDGASEYTIRNRAEDFEQWITRDDPDAAPRPNGGRVPRI